MTFFVFLCALIVFYVFRILARNLPPILARNLPSINIVWAYFAGILTGYLLKDKPFSKVVLTLLTVIGFYIAFSAASAIVHRFRRSGGSAPPER